MKIWIIVLFSFVAVATVFLVVACKSSDDGKPNQELAKFVDIERFMGTWHVHGYTPTMIDKNAFGATETYERTEDGRIATRYRFRKGGADGKVKTFNPVGWVYNKETGSEWRMKFFGLFTSKYYILYVDDEYEYTVVGHPNKELAWIMSRQPEIEEATYERLRQELVERGYALEELQRVEH